MIVDQLRAGYVGAIKPWRGSDDTIAIRWYRAKPGAKEFPYPSAFTSSVWDTFAGAEEPEVGEVKAYRIWSPTKWKDAPPGDHFHGDPDWWLRGIPAEHRHDVVVPCMPACLMTDPLAEDIYPEQGAECLMADP